MNAERRRKLIARVKMAQAELKLDDDVYRAVLLRVTGKNSCRELNESQLLATIRELERLGLKPYHRMPMQFKKNMPLMKKIEALLADKGLPWAYADGMARKMFNKNSVSLLDGSQLHKIVAALEISAKRAAKY